MDGHDELGTVTRNDLQILLERANASLQAAVARIDALEERLAKVSKDAPVAEVVTGGVSVTAKWEWLTICDDPKSMHREDARIAEALNDGWEIQSVQYAQSAAAVDGIVDVIRTRVVNLQRLKVVEVPPVAPVGEGAEAGLSVAEVAADEGETVIETEPVLVVQGLPANMRIVDALPEELLVERAEVAGMTYAEALRDPRTTAEDMAAIHKRETVSACKAKRAEMDEQYRIRREEWAAKWAAAGMPFETPSPSWARS